MQKTCYLQTRTKPSENGINNINNALQEKFTELGITDYTSALDTFVTDTFLRPNDLNLGSPISNTFISNNKVVLNEIYIKLDSTDMIADLNSLFIILYEKASDDLKNKIILVSKTRFLTYIVASLLYGMLVEIKDVPSMQNNPFHLTY